MKLQAIYSLIFVIALSAAGVSAQAKQGKELREAVDQVDEASKAITEIMRAEDKSIPRDLLNKAEAVVVFPGTVKAALSSADRADRVSRSNARGMAGVPPPFSTSAVPALVHRSAVQRRTTCCW